MKFIFLQQTIENCLVFVYTKFFILSYCVHMDVLNSILLIYLVFSLLNTFQAVKDYHSQIADVAVLVLDEFR